MKTTQKQLWSNEKVVVQLISLRVKAVASGNASYAALLSRVIGRVDPDMV